MRINLISVCWNSSEVELICLGSLSMVITILLSACSATKSNEAEKLCWATKISSLANFSLNRVRLSLNRVRFSLIVDTWPAQQNSKKLNVTPNIGFANTDDDWLIEIIVIYGLDPDCGLKIGQRQLNICPSNFTSSGFFYLARVCVSGLSDHQAFYLFL